MDYGLSDATAVLARTPSTLRALLAGLPDSWLHANEGPGTWSPTEVVGHLVEAERRLWIPRARVILTAGEEKPFEPFDRSSLLERHRGRSLEEMMNELEELRAESLRSLGGMGLGERELSTTGRHPELGTITLRQLLAAWVVHDLGHLRQIARTMAKQYRSAVGPWAKYLRVLEE